MENTDYIDRYFNNELSADEKNLFEQKIITDKDFAEEVAFYYTALQTAKNELNEEKKKRFNEIYERKSSSSKPGIIRSLRIYGAAVAAIAAIIFSWYLFVKPTPPPQLADQYIQEHFQTLEVTMSSKQDSMQVVLNLYNDGKLSEALQQFEKMIESDSANTEAKINAGIVSLRLKNYDKAVTYFSQLENNHTLFSNPSKLYKAITLMKRNNAGDAEQAKDLLHQVVQNNLEGKETAEEWLNKKW